MVKSSRKSTAAALSTTETRNTEDETTDDIAPPPAEGGADGLVVLNSRRPLRSLRSNQTRNDVGEQIGEQLRSLYEDVLNQPIPDRFLELLNRLESDPISPTPSKAPPEA